MSITSRGTSQAHALRWWTRQQRQQLGESLDAALQAWAGDWLPERNLQPRRIHVALAWEDPLAGQTRWLGLGSRGHSAAWLADKHNAEEILATWIFNADQGATGGPIAASCAARAHAALRLCLRQHLALDAAGDATAPAPHLLRAWSGAVVLSVGLAQAERLHILLNRQACEHLLGPAALSAATVAETRPALSPLPQALSRQRLRARVEMNPVELDIGTLSHLLPGDVIRLPHALARPLGVTVQGTPVCGAYLGRQGAHRAIELVRDAGIAPATSFGETP